MKNIRKRRQALEMTQEELAQLLNVSVRTVRYWESGEVHPGKKLPLLAMELKCTEAYLVSTEEALADA